MPQRVPNSNPLTEQKGILMRSLHSRKAPLLLQSILVFTSVRQDSGLFRLVPIKRACSWFSVLQSSRTRTEASSPVSLSRKANSAPVYFSEDQVEEQATSRSVWNSNTQRSPCFLSERLLAPPVHARVLHQYRQLPTHNGVGNRA